MSARTIAKNLRKALLQDGSMQQALYEFELAEHLEDWYQGLQDDGDEFIFAVTEREGDVAMVLITAEKSVFVNEQARAKLLNFWPKAYRKNMEQLIPLMAQQLAQDVIPINGVKTVSAS